jgi:hypothetical protein
MVALVAAGVAVASDTAWFDMEKCAMCTTLFKNPELMANTNWEQHNIKGGVVSISTVGEKWLPQFRMAHADMMKVVAKAEKGEKVDMCGSCNAFGAFMKAGATRETVETSTGEVCIVTSTKPEVVAQIQTWAKRNTEEMAKMATPTTTKTATK